MATDWYFASGREKLGPYPLEALKQAARDGRISASTLVWTEAYGAQWRPARDVEMLAGLLRASPPPLPDEHPAAKPSEPSHQAGSTSAAAKGPSAWVYIGAWVVAMIIATIINLASLFVGGMTLAEEFVPGAIMIVIGTLFAASAVTFVFEALFRQLKMVKVLTAGFWLGGIGVALTALNAGVALTSGNVSSREMDMFLLFMATPVIFWAVVLANLWRMAKQGRIYPAQSCAGNRSASKDAPGAKLAGVLVSLAALAIVYGVLFVVVNI